MTTPNDPSGATPPQWSAPSDLPAPSAGQAPAGPANPVVTAGGPPPVYVPPPASAPTVPVSPATSIARPARRRGAIDIVLVVAAVFAVGGIGFAVGRVTAPATAAASATGNGQFRVGNGGAGTGQFGNGGNGGGFFGGGAGAGITISGEVTEVTADHLTLKLASGQTVQIPISSSTTYHSQAPATATDVTTGSTVQVQVTRGGGNGGPNASPGTGQRGFALGTASSVTVVPK